MSLLTVTLGLVAMFWPAEAAAQAGDIKRLLTASAISCDFGKGSVGEWANGRFKVEGDQWMGATTYASIDHESGRAELQGNSGSTTVMVLPSPAGLTFMEATNMGNLSFVTVYASACGSDFCAVMSRHMNLLGSPLSSQYHGTCRVVR